MDSIIKKFFHTASQTEYKYMYDTEDMNNLHKYEEQLMHDFFSDLPKEKRELFEKIMECRQYEKMARTELYAYGFRCGGKLMLELLSNDPYKSF